MPCRMGRLRTGKRKRYVHADSPPPSPSISEGPSAPPPNVLSPVDSLNFRRPPRGGSNDGIPIGFPMEHNMCYRNATLSLLMNLVPFLGYLSHFSMNDRKAGENVLFELGDMATIYWSDGSAEERRERLGETINKLWAHLLYLNYDDQTGTIGWGPFLDFQQQETQQDAADFLGNLLTNSDGENYNRDDDRDEYKSMVEATFLVRTCCAGNCKNRKTRRDQLERTRLWTVDIDHSRGEKGGTLEDCIRTTLTNNIELSCSTCRLLVDQDGKHGRIWHRIHSTPEILFIRISRFEPLKTRAGYRKCNNEVLIPEILDLTPHLEDSSGEAGVEARYRLCGAINHAGTMQSGHFVTHVRAHDKQWYRLDDETVTDSSIATLNADPIKYGRCKFTPYVLAYTKIFHDNESTGPSPTPSPPSPRSRMVYSKEQEPRLTITVELAGQIHTLTKKVKGFNADRNSMEIGIKAVMDLAGQNLFEVDLAMLELSKTAQTDSRGAVGAKTRNGATASARLPWTPTEPRRDLGLVTPPSSSSTMPLLGKWKIENQHGGKRVKRR